MAGLMDIVILAIPVGLGVGYFTECFGYCNGFKKTVDDFIGNLGLGVDPAPPGGDTGGDTGGTPCTKKCKAPQVLDKTACTCGAPATTCKKTAACAKTYKGSCTTACKKPTSTGCKACQKACCVTASAFTYSAAYHGYANISMAEYSRRRFARTRQLPSAFGTEIDPVMVPGLSGRDRVSYRNQLNTGYSQGGMW